MKHSRILPALKGCLSNSIVRIIRKLKADNMLICVNIYFNKIYCHVHSAPKIPRIFEPYLKYHGVPSSTFSWFGFVLCNRPRILSFEKIKSWLCSKIFVEQSKDKVMNLPFLSEALQDSCELKVLYECLSIQNLLCDIIFLRRTWFLFVQSPIMEFLKLGSPTVLQLVLLTSQTILQMLFV